MAEMTRSPDYLRITASTARRVRNLETGVHPTSSGLNYYDTFGPLQFPDDSSALFNVPSAQERAGWQRRMGIVQTFGFYTGQWGASDSEFICQLPREARPRVIARGILSMGGLVPYIAFARVEINGDFYLEKAPGTATGVTCAVYLTGLSWAVN